MASTPAPKRVSYRRKSATQRRRELIGAGIACLARGGMTAFTIDQICSEAGVSRGLINHHFKTKQDLLLCIYTEMTDYLVKEFSSDDARLQLRESIDANFDVDSFNPQNLRAWLSIWGEVASNKNLRSLHRKRYLAYKNKLIIALSASDRVGRKKPDIDRIARQLIALIDGLWLEYCLHSTSFSLAAAKQDCYRLLDAYGYSIRANGSRDEQVQR